MLANFQLHMIKGTGVWKFVNQQHIATRAHNKTNSVAVLSFSQHGGFRFIMQGSGCGMGRIFGSSPGVTLTDGCNLHSWVTPSDPWLTSKNVKTLSSVSICNTNREGKLVEWRVRLFPACQPSRHTSIQVDTGDIPREVYTHWTKLHRKQIQSSTFCH